VINVFAHIDDSKGNRVAEMIGPANALSKDADSISQGIYLLSDTIIRGLKPDSFGGFLGGRFGYATDYENEVFRLRFDRQHGECSCGFEKLAEEWHSAHPHSSECYYSRFNALTDAWEKEHNWGFTRGDERRPLYDQKDKYENKISRSLCKELGIPWNKGWRSACHCTCGKDDQAKLWFSDPAHDHIEPCDIWWMSQPLFIHKRTGFEVSWYKWIGRDMKMNRESILGEEWSEIIQDCYRSIPEEARLKAQAERDYEDTPEYKSEQEAAQNSMMEFMLNPAKYGCPVKKHVCDSCGKEYEYQDWATIVSGSCDDCTKKRFQRIR
jgi:hypothetical protein